MRQKELAHLIGPGHARRWVLRTAVGAVLVGTVLLSAGCASGASQEMAAEPAYAMRAAGTAPASAPRVRTQADTGAGAVPTADRSRPADSQAPQPQERLRVFAADLELVVSAVDRARTRILTLVEQLGGYVESSTNDYLMLRVPKDSFDRALAEIQEEGEVRSRSVRTADVTEQFADLERRLQIAQAARTRLYELLEETEDTDERVKIVQEIRRLTEQIERLQATRDSLSSLIEYSRITVRLVARIAAQEVSRADIPFRWIANLDPVYQSVGEARRPFELAVPADFAVFTHGKQVQAEAADGTRLRAGAVKNEPAGDTEFWSSALVFHLSDFYASAGPVDTGTFAGALFRSKDVPAYYYLVAVRAADQDLEVVEAFFPDETTKDNRLESLIGMLEEVE